MTWENYIYFAIISSLFLLASGLLVYKKNTSKKISTILLLLGLGILGLFIVGFWIELGRPPMRTMGETRLWYSFFIILIGFIAYRRWSFPWILSFSCAMGIVFMVINITKPEIHSKSLMPALQSIWFVPHVLSYMMSYAMLGAACLGAIAGLYKKQDNVKLFDFVDNMVYVGYGFLMLGLLMGAIWAKQAWGHYWSWDPKETWALITCASYLVYIHLRLKSNPKLDKIALWCIIISFAFLMFTWLGVSLVTVAQNSLHSY